MALSNKLPELYLINVYLQSSKLYKLKYFLNIIYSRVVKESNLLSKDCSHGVQTMVAELLISLDKHLQFVINERQVMVATLLDQKFKDHFMSPVVC